MSVVQVCLGRPRGLLPSIFSSISCSCGELCLIRCPRYCNNARNGSREKKQRKATTKMGERHQRHVRYDDSGKQSGGGPASISQRHLGSDVLTRIC